MNHKNQNIKALWPLAGIFLLLAAGILAAGKVYLTHQKYVARQEVSAQLEAIAKLKSSQISQWLNERMADGKASSAPGGPFAIAVSQWLADQSNVRLRSAIIARMDAFEGYDQYRDIMLLDGRGNLLLAASQLPHIIGDTTKRLTLRAIASREVVFSDFYYCDICRENHLDIIAPLFQNTGTMAPASGVLLLRIDANKYLYPLVQTWPVPSKSAETVLAEQSGDSVLFLNELRYRKDTALRFKIPISDTMVPAVKAARGYRGVTEGSDYRGVRVLSAIAAVPGTHWLMVAKVDRDEVFAPIDRMIRMAGIAIGLLVLLAAALTSVIFHVRQGGFYKAQYRAELERQALVSHYDYIVKYANDILFLTDDQNRIIEANDRALQAYGRSRDELLGKTADILRSPKAKPLFKSQMQELRSKGTLLYETMHARKDGREFPVEISARQIVIDGKGYLQGIVRDISERKKTQAEIAARNKSLELLHQCALDLASLPEGHSLSDTLTEWLKKLSGGYAVTFGEYDRNKKEIVLKRILLEPGALARIESAIGNRLMDVRSPVSAETYRLMMAEQVGTRQTLHEITFGAIPKMVSTTIGVMLGIEQYVAIVYQVEGTIYGTSVIALKKGQPEPDHAALKAFAALGAVSLRRAIAEDKLQSAHEELQASYEEIEANNQQLHANNEMLAAAEQELRRKNEELTASEEELKANEEELEQQLGEIQKNREELGISEVRYRRLFEAAKDGILILNAETGVIEDANPFIKELLCYPIEELMGRELWQIGLFKDIVASRENFLELQKKSYVRYEDMPLQTKDGQKREVEFVSNVYPVGDHNVVQCNIRDITARKRAEESLRKSEEENRAIVNAVPDILFRIDSKGMILDYRARTESMLYASPDAFLGKKIDDVMPERVSALAKDAIAKTLANNAMSQFDYALDMPEGVRSYECRIAPLSGAQVLAVIREITERKRAEQELKANQEQLDNAMDIARLGHWEYDVIKDTFTFNDHFYKIFRTTANKVGGYTMRSADYARRFVHPEDAPRVGDEIRKSIEARSPSYSNQLEHRIIYDDGSVGYITVKHFVVKDAQNRTIRTYGVNQDITERKRAEEALRELTSRQEALLAAIPEIIMEVDVNKKYLWANHAGLIFFGDDVVGHEAMDYFECEQSTYDVVKPLFEGSEDLIYVESWQRRKDGRKRLLAWWCRTLRNEQGKVTGVLSSALDITERKLADEQIKKQLAELQRWQSSMLDREDRLRELKREINKLLAQAGQPPRYTVAADRTTENQDGRHE